MLQQLPLKSILRAEEGSAPALPVQESELLYQTQHDLDHLPSMTYDLVTPVASPETAKKVPEDKSTVEWLKNLLGDLILSSTSGKSSKFPHSVYSVENESHSKEISRQFAQEEIFEPKVETTPHQLDSIMLRDIQKAKRTKKDLVFFDDDINSRPSTSKEPTAYVTEMDITADKQSKFDNDGASNKTAEQIKEATFKNQNVKKSNLKTIAIQTEKRKYKKRTRVQISETNVQIKSDSDQQTSTTTDKKDVDKETQTKEKEKQD